MAARSRIRILESTKIIKFCCFLDHVVWRIIIHPDHLSSKVRGRQGPSGAVRGRQRVIAQHISFISNHNETWHKQERLIGKYLNKLEVS